MCGLGSLVALFTTPDAPAQALALRVVRIVAVALLSLPVTDPGAAAPAVAATVYSARDLATAAAASTAGAADGDDGTGGGGGGEGTLTPAMLRLECVDMLLRDRE